MVEGNEGGYQPSREEISRAEEMMTDEQKELTQERYSEIIMGWIGSFRGASENPEIDERNRKFFGEVAPVIEDVAKAAQEKRETSILLSDDERTSKGFLYYSMLSGASAEGFLMLSEAVKVLSGGEMEVSVRGGAEKPQIRVSRKSEESSDKSV